MAEITIDLADDLLARVGRIVSADPKSTPSWGKSRDALVARALVEFLPKWEEFLFPEPIQGPR